MKKMLSFILMLAIVLLPASAIAAPGDAILLRQGVDGYASNVISMAEVDGTLYILTYDGLLHAGKRRDGARQAHICAEQHRGG